jgi:hypothetical protein
MKMKYLKNYDKVKNEAWFTPPPPPTPPTNIENSISKDDIKSDKSEVSADSGSKVSGDTIKFSTARQLSTQLKVEFGVSRTTLTPVVINSSGRNTEEVQENLPKGPGAGTPTHTIKFMKSDFQKAIQEGREVFYYSKYTTDIAPDFLSVGGKGNQANRTGTVVLDFEGPDEEIIASGNGLLLLMRLAANNQKNIDGGKGFLKLNIMNMGEATAGKDKSFKDTDIISIVTNSDKATQARTLIYFLFTVSDPSHNEAIKKPLSDKSMIRKYQSAHGRLRLGLRDGQIMDHRLKGLGDIINKTPEVNGVIPKERDEMVIDHLAMELMLMNDFLYPNLKVAYEKPLNAKIMDRATIGRYLEEFKSAQNDKEKDAVFIRFMEEAMDGYKNNFLDFVDSYTKNLGVSRETVLGNFNIEQSCKGVITQLKNILKDSEDKSYKDKSGDLKVIPSERSKQIETISQAIGTVGLKSIEVPPPHKKVEVSKTDVIEGKTTYVIKNKSANTTLKNEKFKIIKTFERFKFGRFK